MLKNPQIFLQKQKKMSFFSLLEWYNRFDVNVQRCLFLGDIFVFIHHNARTTLKAPFENMDKNVCNFLHDGGRISNF